MSSDSSVSSRSRIGQFGLYRTIDSRTEEFLRLSRKRQIRQGCACAAASTAITVTVVIVVFFIYEFSLNSDLTLETAFKTNWLNSMNKSTGDSSFDPKLTKANIDRTTLKLLPLLLKAIKKNAYLEKFLEDHSSSSPSYDEKENAEDAIEQNTYSRNWFKMPTTKLYAIEYKTSPVVFYKNPTENIEYYTKIRKIRDYQRVFKYVDKMISEKVYIRATKPMLKGELYTEIPPVYKPMPVKKITHKSTTSFQEIRQSQTQSTRPDEKVSSKTKFQCKCPKKFSEILNKILAAIQKILPESNHKETTMLNSIQNQTPRNLGIATDANNELYNAFPNLLVKSQIVTKSESASARNGINPLPNKIFSFQFDQVTEPNTHVTNNINRPSKAKVFEQTTIGNNVTEIINTENNDQTTQPVQFINKYKNIIQRKQLLRKHMPKTTNTFYEPIFDDIDYEDYYAVTQNPTKTTIKENKHNCMKTKNNNTKDFVLKINQIKNKTIIPEVYKMLTPRIQQVTRKAYIQAIGNKSIFMTAKPIRTNEIKILKTVNNGSHAYSSLNNVIDFLRPNFPLTVPEREKNINHDNTKLIQSEDVVSKIQHNINRTDESIIHKKVNLDTLKRLFFNLTDSKNTYRLEKNAENFMLHKKNQDVKTNDIKSNTDLKLTSTDTPKRMFLAPFNANDLNNKTIYPLAKSIVKSYLDNYLNPLKLSLTHLGKNKVTTEKSEFTSATMSQKQDNSNSSDLIEDDVEFSTGEISEITKQPDSTTDKPDKNIFTKIDDYNLAWEDLNSENMATSKSMVPEPKPLYLEFHRNNIIHEEPQNDDYNINSNFYDLNL